MNLVRAGYHGRFRTPAMVIQAPGQRPQFRHVAGASLPPTCGGPDIVGWSWKGLKSESYAGTRWGSFVLVGTFDGKTFTLTQPAVADDGTLKRPRVDSNATTPCPKPVGGWRPTNPAKATNAAFESVSVLAREQSGFGQIWLDQPSVNGRPGNNKPRPFILNVGTTGDVAKVESRLREVWGGSLCVSKIPRTEAKVYAL